jgi:EAL domain-containing protein (putative c-di-GMP-specific phosphodiesterase class I)
MHRIEDLSHPEPGPISAQQLQIAIERGEFVLHHQPKIDLASGQIVGSEVLIRWQHPIHGLLRPLAFMPLAEASGLVIGLGKWVLAEATRAAVRINRGRLCPLQVSANASPLELTEPGYAASVARALERSACDPAWLTIEITEAAHVREVTAVSDCLHDLRCLGVGVSLDDFGLGYSSLYRLVDWPFSELKIDRAFVSGLAVCRKRQAVVSHAVALGRDLGLEVVAEGVETTGELAALVDMRCPIGQGFLFSRPVVEQAFLELLANRTGAGKC